ncbi:uncharacterized protein RBU33_020518 [Hipposideros larvatus]
MEIMKKKNLKPGKTNCFAQGQTASYPGLEPKPPKAQGSCLCTAIRNYIFQKPAERTGENYSSQKIRRCARSLVSLLSGAESGRAELGFFPPRLVPGSQLCPMIGG